MMPMKDKANWEKSSETLVAFFGELMRKGPGITTKKMFG